MPAPSERKRTRLVEQQEHLVGLERIAGALRVRAREVRRRLGRFDAVGVVRISGVDEGRLRRPPDGGRAFRLIDA